MSCPRSLLLSILFLPLAAPSGAATHTWPGAAPCAGTLQACIDGVADNDQIRIATDAPITASVSVQNKRLALSAADGYRPVFQNASLIAINTAGFTGDTALRLSGIHFEGGHVTATHSGSGTATFDFRELRVSPAAGNGGISIEALGGTVEATLYDNRISGGPSSSFWGGLISLWASQGSTMNAEVFHNHVSRSPAGDGAGAGIRVQYQGSGTTGTVKLHGNTLRGHFRTAGILLGEGSADTPAATSYNARVYNNAIVGTGHALSLGIRLGVANGQIDAQLINNTITQVHQAVVAGRWVSGGTGTLAGMLHNNILIADQAVSMESGAVAGVANLNNLINGSVFGIVADPSTITAPARLTSRIDARPAPDSPAIDAGNSEALALGLLFNGLPVTDADGLRRFKKKTPGTSGTARPDIGAYEYGDINFMHVTATGNTSGHITELNHPAINDQSTANLFATPRFLGGIGAESGQPVGTWEFSGTWSLYNKNSALPMPLHARYNVFSAGAGSGVFRHVSTAGNTSGATTQIDTAVLGDDPDLIVLAMQNFNAGAAGNPHHTGVFHFSLGGSGAWFVTNLNSAQPMAVGTGFSIYAQRPSPNVFQVTATAANRPAGDSLYLDHPLLNGNPCAQPVITRVYTGSDGSNYDVSYLNPPGRWTIYDYDGMALGSRFNVLVNPAQAETCGGEIFSDGFE